MSFFTIEEFKNKYNQDVEQWQIETACEMIYSQVGLRYRDLTWDATILLLRLLKMPVWNN